jgi:protoporphyrinogen oxidase
MKQEKPTVLCIGAGPAGLTAAHRLSRSGIPVTVLERDPVYVGGISRTENYKGFRFDVGGHRFFSRSREIEALWDEILGDQLIKRPRKSRILYRSKLFDYPLRPLDALSKLGLTESTRCMLSYFKAKLFPIRNPQTFEDWVTNQFGKRLYNIFFKTYTEKVWGMKCQEISADWAAQRIKGLSLGTAVWKALVPSWIRRVGETPKTLIEFFRYPRLGPGQMWEAAVEQIQDAGGNVLMDMNVSSLQLDPEAGEWKVTAVDSGGVAHEYRADHVISSAAIRDLAEYLDPRPPEAVLTAARALRYRDFLTVALIVRDVDCFDDNWIYIHDSSVRVGRIQNFKSWSPHMIPDPDLNCLGLEYFCFQGDGTWNSSDEDLIRLADEELIHLGLVKPGHVIDGKVIRQAAAYPVYDENYEERVALFQSWLNGHMPGLHLVGRNGMHKYNNQDHAMMTALLTAENIMAGEKLWDVWRVNQDADYHEVGEDRTLAFSERQVPGQVRKDG